MSTRVLRFAAAYLVALLASPSILAAPPTGPRLDATEIRLHRSLSGTELAQELAEKNIRPVELLHYGHDFTAGYSVAPDESVEQAVMDMESKHREFLESALDSLAQAETVVLDDPVQLQGFAKLRLEFQEALEQLNSSGLRIGGLLIEGRPQSVERLDRPAAGSPPSASSASRVKAPSTNHESWAPYRGTSRVTDTFTFQTFYFNNVKSFTTLSSYEHETQIYDTAYSNYDRYWSSNMPRHYLDSRLFDAGVDNFAVGTTAPSSFSTYQQYWTYLSLKRGKANSARVRIKGQLGRKNSSTCHSSTWCVLRSVDTTSSLTTYLLPNSSTKSWRY